VAPTEPHFAVLAEQHWVGHETRFLRDVGASMRAEGDPCWQGQLIMLWALVALLPLVLVVVGLKGLQNAI
jgi:hypothetical protein